MEQVSPFALTTLQRVKDLLFDPALTIQVTGTTTNNSPVVSSTVVQTGKVVRNGQTITGPGIPANTTVVSTDATGNTLTLSQAATAAATGVVLTVIDQASNYDTVLIRLINWATDYIQNECGGRIFVQKTYTNDVYSIHTPRQSFLQLRQYPVFSVTSFQWRAGTPTNPNWTDFIGDQWELIDPVPNPANSEALYYPKGIIRVYGVLPRIYNNMIRVTYVAGYPVNWNNAEDSAAHMLPGDLTNLCENLVVRRFKRRQLAGQSSHSLEGATTSYRNVLDAEDQDVIDQYRDIRF